jgi:hypothetical protein
MYICCCLLSCFCVDIFRVFLFVTYFPHSVYQLTVMILCYYYYYYYYSRYSLHKVVPLLNLLRLVRVTTVAIENQ